MWLEWEGRGLGEGDGGMKQRLKGRRGPGEMKKMRETEGGEVSEFEKKMPHACFTNEGRAI